MGDGWRERVSRRVHERVGDSERGVGRKKKKGLVGENFLIITEVWKGERKSDCFSYVLRWCFQDACLPVLCDGVDPVFNINVRPLPSPAKFSLFNSIFPFEFAITFHLSQNLNGIELIVFSTFQLCHFYDFLTIYSFMIL